MLPSCRGDATHRTTMCYCTSEKFEIPGGAVAPLGSGPSDHPGMTGSEMPGFWGNNSEQGSAVTADFKHALMQQGLRTELIRIKALIGTTALLAVMLLTIHTIDPYAVEHLWHGRLKPADLYRIMIPFIVFE